MRKTPKKGGELGFFKKLFQHNKFKHNINKNKKIELENSNSDFIVVRHFLTYVHFPQPPNRVRVPLSWSFNQASNLFTIGLWFQFTLLDFWLQVPFTLLQEISHSWTTPQVIPHTWETSFQRFTNKMISQKS